MFDSQKLHQQFVLSKRRLRALSGFRQYKMGGWELAAHPSLPVSRLVDSNGLELGWALGDIFGSGIERPGEDIILPDQHDIQPTWFGRYLIVRIDGGKSRMYPDSCASLGAVYSKAHQLAASTVTIGMIAAGVSDGWEPDIDIVGPDQSWPCGLTSSPAFRRLLPNHYCDLESWVSTRKWLFVPTAERARVSRDVFAASRALVDCVGQTVRRYSDVYLPLTAGVDSRAIAAAVIASGYEKSIECVTFCYEGSSDTSDRDGAAAIARRFGLSHRTIIARHADEKTKRDYQLRTGYSGHWGKSREFRACLENLDMSAAWMPGFVGELGRAYEWKREHSSLSAVVPAPEQLAWWPESADCRNAVIDWLSGLPPRLNRWAIFDLGGLEIDAGCWASPHLYGSAPFRAQILPWGHPTVIKAAFALPDAYRQSGAFNKHIIAKLVPGLLQIPFGTHASSPDTLRRKASRFRFRYPSLWPVLSLLSRRSYRKVRQVEEAKDA